MPDTQTIHQFDPVLFSLQECRWLVEHLDEAPVVAMRSLEPGVNPRQVRPLLERIQELKQMQEHDGTSWVGTDAIRDSIRIYLREDTKWRNDYKRRRGAPRFPSLYSFDSKGRPHRGGPGSDSGRVRTYFDEQGNRRMFAIELQPAGTEDWTAPGFTEELSEGLVNNGELNRLECFCGHTESYKSDSRQSYQFARSRMSKHLRKATESVERHREIHTAEFGGASV